MKRKAKRIVSLTSKSATAEEKLFQEKDDGFGRVVPPSRANVEIYFDQKGLREVALDFYDEHQLRQWRNQNGQPITNWKVYAAEWIYNHRQEMKRKFRQSSFYSDLF